MRSFSYSRPLGKEVCNISTNLFRLVNDVHESKGKQDVVADIAPAVLADLPVRTRYADATCSDGSEQEQQQQERARSTTQEDTGQR